MLSVFKREIKSLFCGYKAYSFIAIFALCYLAVRMMYSYMLLYENIYGFLNQEYILALLPGAFALAVPLITFSMYDDERKKNVFYFLRSLPISEAEIFWGKYLSRIALFGASYAVLLVIDAILGFYGASPVFTLIYSSACYVIICAAVLSLNIFLATVFKNKFIALGVGYGLSAVLIALTLTYYSMPMALREIAQTLSVFGTYTAAVFGVVDIAYLFLYVSLGGLFTYLSYALVKKEIRL